jgi:hypothetical protein
MFKSLSLSLILFMASFSSSFDIYEETKTYNIEKTKHGLEIKKREVIETDGAAFGFVNPSILKLEKGVRIKKIVDIPRLSKHAEPMLLVYFDEVDTLNSLTLSVNGNIMSVKEKCYRGIFNRIAVENNLLKKGVNTVEFWSDKKDSKWSTMIARSEYFKSGGLVEWPKKSFISRDSGKTWNQKNMISSPHDDYAGEYPIRILLNQYQNKGFIESPVIDLHIEENIAIDKDVKFVTISSLVKNPADTDFRLYVSQADTISNWSEFELFTGKQIDNPARFIKWRAELISLSGESSPILTSIDIKASSKKKSKLSTRNIYVEKRAVCRSFYDFKFEPYDLPLINQIRKEYQLDTLRNGASTELALFERIRNFARTRFRWTGGSTRYLNMDCMIKQGEGMCFHYSVIIMQVAQALGIPARMASISNDKWGHEVAELWSDTYGKWILMDGLMDTHFEYSETKIPMSLPELHRELLDAFFIKENKKILSYYEWQAMGAKSDYFRKWVYDNKKSIVRLVNKTTETEGFQLYNNWCGGNSAFITAGHLRYYKRSNFLEQPFPAPTNNGSSIWAWNGFFEYIDTYTNGDEYISYYTDKKKDVEFDLNGVDFYASIIGDSIQIQMETTAPYFQGYEIMQHPESAYKKCGNIIMVSVKKGKNEIKMRVLTRSGFTAQSSTLSFEH